MKKILVPTDLSTFSKAAIRFAIQLAKQGGYQLTFFHSYEVLKPTSWSEPVFLSFEKSESTKVAKRLIKFIGDVYKSLNIEDAEPECVAHSGTYVDMDIMNYASKNHYDFICISRKGSGKTAKLFGTTVSRLIKKSTIPVIAVPSHYRSTPISRITFASDLTELDSELKKVMSFAETLSAKVNLLHFKGSIDFPANDVKQKSVSSKLEQYNIEAQYEVFDYEKPLSANIIKFIERCRPSMLIMFTDQNRSLFERIFMSSISAEFSLMTKIPLLVFGKS